jgi:hypothetical protein
MYAVSAAVCAFFFLSWKRVEDDVKKRLWRRYGWFSALAVVGSVGGLVTAAADMQFRNNFQRIAKSFEHGDLCAGLPNFFDKFQCYQPHAATLTRVNYWLAVSPVPYAIEFLCLCCANLLVRSHSCLRSQISCPVLKPQPNRHQVIERMVEFVVKGQQFRGRWINLLPRIAVVCVTVLNAMNVVFMAVFSYFASKGSLQLCLHSPHFNISPRLLVVVQVGHKAGKSRSWGLCALYF